MYDLGLAFVVVSGCDDDCERDGCKGHEVHERRVVLRYAQVDQETDEEACGGREGADGVDIDKALGRDIMGVDFL